MRIERQLQGTLIGIFTELIKERQLEGKIAPYPVQEEHRADITLKKASGKTLFFIELKDPRAKDGRTVWDADVLLREMGRAQEHQIKYFGNCNFIACALINVEKIYEKNVVASGGFTILEIQKLSQNYIINKDAHSKLRQIASFYLDRAEELLARKPIKYTPLDELFIFKISKLIEAFAIPIGDKVFEAYKNDRTFHRRLAEYAKSQLWAEPTTYEEVEKLTHIALLMLISKLIFYKAYVDNQVRHRLSPMIIPKNISSAQELEEVIWSYFDEFKEITQNFELLIGERSDIIFQLPFVSDAILDLVTDVLQTGSSYNFSAIAYDVVGRIFEELIREDERHKLGQYFTSPNVIDLINAFCINHADDVVFDPSCGSGTFLVRAYERKRELSNQEKTHPALLQEIYGNDLSGYPAYLSMLNLAIRNTRKASYPQIINKDFFSIHNTSMLNIHDQDGQLIKRRLPKFDAIIGNPPYTRQEDIGTMHGTVSKERIQALSQRQTGFVPSKRTSIYGYFFYHAGSFLKDDGYLGFICQNSWLETEYGADMQRFFLNQYQIVAIIDSEVERFFPTASVNTTIVILKRQRSSEIRRDNKVRFIWFTERLDEIIEKYSTTDKLVERILENDEGSEDNLMRINVVQQDDLHNTNKWTKFLKAPTLYWKLMETGKFDSLSNHVDSVRFGIKTGNNDFFILKDITSSASSLHLSAAINSNPEVTSIKELKQKGLVVMKNGYNEIVILERESTCPILTSPKDLNTYAITRKDIDSFVFLVNTRRSTTKEQLPYSYKYIQHAEKNDYNQNATLISRKQWYSLGIREIPSLSFNYMIGDVGRTFKFNGLSNNNFHNIYVQADRVKTVWYYMNSTIAWLFQQLEMRTNLGDGAGKIETYELAQFPFPNINLENFDIDLGANSSYVEELGDSTLAMVNPARVSLDTKILSLLGIKSKTLQNEMLTLLYDVTFRLIESRLQKASSQKSAKTQRNRVELEVYIARLQLLLQEGNYKASNSLRFARELKLLVSNITSEKKLQSKILNTYWRSKYGQSFNEKDIGDQDQTKLF